MSGNNSISGIGYLTSPLGMYGLGVSPYSSYDACMPSMMGMYPSMMMGMDPSIFSSMNYGGMMNPYASMAMYPAMMAEVQEMIESRHLDHAANMNTKRLQNEVRARQESLSANAQMDLADGDIQQGIYTLHEAIKSGDQNAVCLQYDKLRSYVYNEYKDEFASKNGRGNAAALVNQKIARLYQEIISASYPQEGTANLRKNIIKYGETAGKNGFMTGFKRDHGDMYVDETLNYIYGERINNRTDKDIWRGVCNGVGRISSVGAKGAIGGLFASGAVYGSCLAFNGLKKLAGGRFNLPKGKVASIAFLVGAGVCALADIGSQIYNGTKNRRAIA